jgi:hypothetical protein
MIIDQDGRRARRRRHSGTTMAELPVVLWVLFVFLLFPLLIFASIGYRASILFFSADSASKKAAKSPTYTDATTRAAAVLTVSLAPFTGIAASAPVISVMVKPIAGGAPTIYTTKLAPGSIDTSKNLYFVMSKVDADLAPLVQFSGGWMGMNIPGLTGPFHLTVNTQAYAENPSGLSQ